MSATSTLSSNERQTPSSRRSGEIVAPRRHSTAVMWLITLLVMVPIFIVAGAIAALGLYAAREWVWNKRDAEAQQTLSSLSAGLARCAALADSTAPPQTLPESSPKVPASLSQVAGKQYQSSALEWAAPAFACAGYARSNPQFFQYQWLRTSPTRGKVWAHADMDGDGVADRSWASEVDCGAGFDRCVVSEPRETAP